MYISVQDPHDMMHIILIVFTIFLNINEITHCRASVQFSHCSISSPPPPSHEHKTMHYVYAVQEKDWLGCVLLLSVASVQSSDGTHPCLKLFLHGWLHGVHCRLALHVTCQIRNLSLTKESDLNQTKTVVRFSALKLWIGSLLCIELAHRALWIAFRPHSEWHKIVKKALACQTVRAWFVICLAWRLTKPRSSLPWSSRAFGSSSIKLCSSVAHFSFKDTRPGYSAS
jgi:hypothetical protein